MLLKYNKITPQATDSSTVQAVAHAANTVTRPGPLTTEWWTVLIAGALSAALGAFGVPGPVGAQVTAIAGPIVLALVYAFVRSQTKGALADALKAIFPQAADGTGAESPASAVTGSAVTNGTAPAPTYQLLAVISPPDK